MNLLFIRRKTLGRLRKLNVFLFNLSIRMSLYFSKKSINCFFFLAKRLKNPISSAVEIGFMFLGSTNLSKK